MNIMPNTYTSKTQRERSESDVLQQVQNEIDDALLLHAPDDWTDEQLGQIETIVLDHTRSLLHDLSIDELRTEVVLKKHIDGAFAETMKLIDSWR
jgi:hypothetical protein